MRTWSTSIKGNDHSVDVYDYFMNQYYDRTPLKKLYD